MSNVYFIMSCDITYPLNKSCMMNALKLQKSGLSRSSHGVHDEEKRQMIHSYPLSLSIYRKIEPFFNLYRGEKNFILSKLKIEKSTVNL